MPRPLVAHQTAQGIAARKGFWTSLCDSLWSCRMLYSPGLVMMVILVVMEILIKLLAPYFAQAWIVREWRATPWMRATYLRRSCFRAASGLLHHIVARLFFQALRHSNVQLLRLVRCIFISLNHSPCWKFIIVCKEYRSSTLKPIRHFDLALFG